MDQDTRLRTGRLGGSNPPARTIFAPSFAEKFSQDSGQFAEARYGLSPGNLYVSSVPTFLVAVGNLPIPAPTTSSATVTYTSATVPVIRVCAPLASLLLPPATSMAKPLFLCGLASACSWTKIR